MVVWCGDWPVVAAGVPAGTPAAVLVSNRVVACSAAARAEGVRRGLRRREAEGRCPGLLTLPQDPATEARAFEPVVAAVEAFAPRVEIVRPGLCAVATKGPARYFGGDEALGGQVAAAVRAALGGQGAVTIGVADGTFAATIAARTDAGVVAAGGTPAFLAPMPVRLLEQPDLVDLLVRLGIRGLGQLADLPQADVLARFGPDGARAWQRARGYDDRPLDARSAPPDLAVAIELDPPADRVDTAAFAARHLAAELHERLAQHALACTRVAIEAETEGGQPLRRLWRHEGTFTAGALAERVRWQLDGWLTANGAFAGGLTHLRLVPDEVVAGGGRQLGFWGGDAEADERAARALARVQGLLGPAAVTTAVLSGGRSPAEQVTLIPWGDPREPARPGPPAVVPDDADPLRRQPPALGRRPKRSMGPVAGETPPWPGHLPGPQPALVVADPVELLDATGLPVTVSGRGEVSAAPHRVGLADRWLTVDGWAGPWPVQERWWDAATASRRARLQLGTTGGAALLLACAGGRWSLEALYD